MGGTGQIDFDDFMKVDIRVGTITRAEPYPEARRPAFKLWVDFGEAIGVLSEHLRAGRLKHHETILEGFDKMPDALMDLFRGANLGKQLVHVA